MKSRSKILVFALILLATVLSDQSNLSLAGEPEADPESVSTTREDLLVFFEEYELIAATKRVTSLRKAPAIASVITSDEIKKMGARTLIDILRTIPSIGISMDEFGRYMIEVRGVRTITSEKLLLMIDGHKLNEAWTGSAIANIYNDLPVENIKQIEIIKGPGSALYGSSAFLAVINIVTRAADEIEGLEAKVTGGSYGTRAFNLTGGKTRGDFAIAANGNYLVSDGPRLRIEKDSLPPALTIAPGETNQRLEKTDLFLKANYRDWYIMGQYIHKSRGANIGFNYALTDNDDLRYDNYWGELGYSKAFSENGTFKARFYFDQFDLDSRFGLLPSGKSPAFPEGMTAKTHLIDRNLGTELQLDYELFPGNHFTVGAQYENIEQYDVQFFANFNPISSPPNQPLGSFQDISTSIGNFNQNASRNIYALYVQDEWAFLPALSLTAGVRYDHYSDFGDTLNPRLGLVWEFLDQADLKLLYGQAFRAPNFKELYDQHNTFSVGNPALKAEKINTFEGAIGNAFGNVAKLNLTYFFNQIKNLIDRDTTQTPTRYINRGEAEIHGLETSLAVILSPSTQVKLGYLHQDARDSKNRIPLDWVPNDRATVILNQEIGRYLHARTDLVWTGSRPRPSGDTRGASAPYTTLDLSLVLKNYIKNLEISGTVRNMLNTRYSDPDTSGALNRIPGDIPREGISGYISLLYKL